MTAAALCLTTTVQAATPAQVLRAGTRVDFVCDDGVNAQTVHPGGVFRIHLSADLVLDGTTIAPAGTTARLTILEKVREADGNYAMQIALSRFHLPVGDLPVTPVDSTIEHISVGTHIAAKTVGSVERADGRIVIRVPLPFALSNEAPAAVFTPIPARTAGPRTGNGPPPRRPSPSPAPTALPSAGPQPTALAT